MEALREGTSSAKYAFNLLRLHRVRGLLVIGEIALAMLLLLAGGLLMHSFVKLASVHPGYDPASSRGRTAIIDYVTTLEAALDTSTLPPAACAPFRQGD
jgi:hypothetical protein